MAEIADERFRQIMQLFNFHDVSDFRYPLGGSKIEIYINRNHSESIAWAYWGGFIITIRSSDIVGHWYNYAVNTTRHELTHIFEFLIEGREGLGTDVWFKEGIAVHIGCLEETGWQTIENLNEFESWHQYYRFFELAVRYLLDSRGMGKYFQNVLSSFYYLRNGRSFPVSFLENFGISVSDFENEFYDLMRAYLGNS